IVANFSVLIFLFVISFFVGSSGSHPQALALTTCVELIIVSLGCVFLGGWTMDPNGLSMHAFYKYRLIRAYLGASNNERARQEKEITESVENDDLLLSDLKNCEQGAPYHLINTTLNMVA